MAVTRKTKGDRVFDVVNFIILLLICLIVAYPLYFVIIASISDPNVVNKGGVIFWPQGATLLGYQKLFQDQTIWRGYANTFFYTLCGTVLDVVVTTCAAYALSRKDLVGRKGLMRYFIFTMYFSGGMIPGYLLMRDLHLMNTVWVMLIPGAMSAYNMIVARTFIQSTISEELLEASKIDGCSDTQFFFRILLPLSKAILAVLGIYYAVGHWNSYFNAFLYLNDRELYPLQIFLRQILIQNNMDTDLMDEDMLAQIQNLQEVLKYSIIVISTAPLMFFYPFVQKYFVKGVMIGSVKG